MSLGVFVVASGSQAADGPGQLIVKKLVDMRIKELTAMLPGVVKTPMPDIACHWLTIKYQFQKEDFLQCEDDLDALNSDSECNEEILEQIEKREEEMDKLEEEELQKEKEALLEREKKKEVSTCCCITC